MRTFFFTFIRHVTNWVHLISNTGINQRTLRSEIKYIRFTNIIALLTVVTIVPHMLFTFVKGYYFFASVELLNAFFIGLVIMGNRCQNYSQARFLYLITVNLYIMLTSCIIGFGGKVYEFFYILTILPFLLFSLRDMRSIVVGVLMALSFLLLYHTSGHYFSGMLENEEDIRQLYYINAIIKFIMFGMAIFILAYHNYKTEDELEESNRKLRVQVEELKRSNEELQQFDYIISHDLKAPVRNISSFMKLLLNRYGENLDKSGRDFIELSKGSSDRLSKQIDELISYCRVDRNLPPTTSVNLSEVFRVVEMELRHNMDGRAFQIEVKGALPVLHNVHANLITHLFRHLVSNGIKFNNSEVPTVTVTVEKEGDELIFSVKDNGIGIDASANNKLFQMFRKLHSSEEYEGSGVGLALCKKIVTSYKGKIWVDGELGIGTVVSFTIYQQPVTSSFAPSMSSSFATSL